MMATIQYIPKSLEAEHANTPVLAIQAYAYDTMNVDPPQSITSGPSSKAGPKTKHWVFFCQIGESSSLGIDPSPTGQDNAVVLAITKESYKQSHNVVKTCELVTQNLTFGGLMNIIKDNKMDKYRSTQSGQGCRYWIYCVIKLLDQKQKFTKRAEVDAVIEALRLVWTLGGKQVPASSQTPIAMGTFYEIKST